LIDDLPYWYSLYKVTGTLVCLVGKFTQLPLKELPLLSEGHLHPLLVEIVQALLEGGQKVCLVRQFTELPLNDLLSESLKVVIRYV
jgi:hypothetical protein